MPKSVKTVGLLLAAVSAFVLTGSIMGLFIADCLQERADSIGASPFYRQTLSYGKPIALLFIVLSLGSGLAGVFIARHKNWARVLGQAVALLYLAYLWHQALFVAGGAGGHAACTVLASLPLLLLVRYLGKEQVRSCFKAAVKKDRSAKILYVLHPAFRKGNFPLRRRQRETD
jgi:uncharacterized protein YneF (UPF0154 family)